MSPRKPPLRTTTTQGALCRQPSAPEFFFPRAAWRRTELAMLSLTLISALLALNQAAYGAYGLFKLRESYNSRPFTVSVRTMVLRLLQVAGPRGHDRLRACAL
jgi:hypothetical protein